MVASPDAWVPLGVVGRPQGLRGAVRFHPHNDHSETLQPGLRVQISVPGAAPRVAAVAQVSGRADALVVQFEGCGDRTAAELLRHAVVSAQRADFPPLEEDEFYHVDLVGCPVKDTSGRSLGEVLRVESYPSIDAAVVSVDGKEIELPLTDAVVVELDLEGRSLTVDLSALDDEA